MFYNTKKLFLKQNYFFTRNSFWSAMKQNHNKIKTNSKQPTIVNSANDVIKTFD